MDNVQPRVDRTRNEFFIRSLLPRHFKMMDMILAGHTKAVISETLKVNPRTISYICRSPLFQAELARKRKESEENNTLGLDRDAVMGKARSILEKATEKAATTLENLMDNSCDESIQLRSAESILNRVFGKGEGAQTLGTAVNVTAENVQLLMVALKESNDAKHKHVHQSNSPTAQATAGEHRDVHQEGLNGQQANGYGISE